MTPLEIELVELAHNIAFSEDGCFFCTTYARGLHPPVYMDPFPCWYRAGCSTVVKIKTDVEQLAEFYRECYRFFDSDK